MYNVQCTMYNVQLYNVQLYNVQLYNVQLYNVQLYNVQLSEREAVAVIQLLCGAHARSQEYRDTRSSHCELSSCI